MNKQKWLSQGVKSWERLDLNLLKVLCILIEERSVTKAAARSFVTRSAMSKSLQRLREMLDDPLLINSSAGMVPTRRALDISTTLSNAFEAIERGISSSSEFDPANATGRLRIAVPETIAIGLMPRIQNHLHSKAPNLVIEVVQLDDAYWRQLEDGELDFAIYFNQNAGSNILLYRMTTSSTVVWCRRDHPVTRVMAVTLEDIGRYPTIAFELPSMDSTDFYAVFKEFVKFEQHRELLIKTSHLMLASITLLESDALWFSFDFVFCHDLFADKVVPISVSHIPLFRNLVIDLCLYQHKRTLTSPVHQWAVAETMQLFSLPSR